MLRRHLCSKKQYDTFLFGYGCSSSMNCRLIPQQYFRWNLQTELFHLNEKWFHDHRYNIHAPGNLSILVWDPRKNDWRQYKSFLYIFLQEIAVHGRVYWHTCASLL